MKIRNGFVTNSSSSSFILSFKDEKDYNDFKIYCNQMNYQKVNRLADKFRELNLDETDIK